MDRHQPYILKRPQAPVTPPSFKIDYEKELNSEQFSAVTTLDGPVLVIAGAGSGKTRTLVYRVARFIESGHSPGSLLLLTFTRKAAQEMLKRAGALLGTGCDGVAGGTFHSFANSVLRRYGSVIGLDPAFTILDRTDSEDCIQILRNDLGFGSKERRFPRKRTLVDILSASVNKHLPVEEVLFSDYSHFSDFLPEIIKLKEAYRDYKIRRNLVDYDDLLVRLKDLMEEHPDIRDRLSESYRAILVDEYQDTNRTQARIVRLLCSRHENVMVVGDDSQSIYSFRGAHFRNIMDFPKEFPDAKIFKLEENYRSTQPILDLTNAIIHEAKEKYPKRLFTRKKEGTVPILIQAESENWQSRFVTQRILELREEGVPLEEIAVLFRSSHHSFDLEVELSKCGLPFIKRGGFKFIETTHVKDSLAHLRVLVNRDDAVSWNRLLLLVEAVGPRKSRAIIQGMAGQEKSDLGKWLGILRRQSEKGVAAPGLRALIGMFENLEPFDQTPSETLQQVCEYYLPYLEKRFDDYPKRVKDLEHLCTMAERYRTIEEFLTDVTLEPPNESVSDIEPVGNDDEQLVLSTIHSAKGLEWHSVFIIWALDGRFPSFYSFDTEEEMEEERRLLYVASTRAKQGLYISYPINIFDKVQGTVLSRPTRFLEGVPRSLYETWNLLEENYLKNNGLSC